MKQVETRLTRGQRETYRRLVGERFDFSKLWGERRDGSSGSAGDPKGR